jgi:hypothetical protein
LNIGHSRLQAGENDHCEHCQLCDPRALHTPPSAAELYDFQGSSGTGSTARRPGARTFSTAGRYEHKVRATLELQSESAEGTDLMLTVPFPGPPKIGEKRLPNAVR